MTVTTSYSYLTDQTFTAVATPALITPGTSPAVTSLANGGYALTVQDFQGFSDLYVYNAAGGLVWSNTSFDATDPSVTQLANGNFLVAGTVGSHVDYRLFSSTGQQLDDQAISRDSNLSNASVTAMKDGGFAVAVQRAFIAPDNDIYVYIHTGSGAAKTVVLDASQADDENPSIATLADGGLAIAWDRVDTSGGTTNGNTSLYEEVLNANGTVRHAATQLDAAGTINLQPKVTALTSGGFSISYEDNGWDGTQADITEANLDANGIFQGYVRLSTSTQADGQTATDQLSTGGVVTAFTRAFGSGTDTDIYFSLYNPVTQEIQFNGVGLQTSTDIENGPAVAALSNGRFAVAYMDASLDTVYTGIFEPQRNTAGDNADNAMQGDTMDDAMYGLGGNDLFIPGNGASNSVDGGTGYDTVNFTATRASVTITRNGLVTSVLRSDGGTDSLTSVEHLHFTDGDRFIAPEVRDLNGDGLSDMLLQNTDGRIAVWQMNGGTITATTVESSNPGTAWAVKGSGDFGGDGYADILLQNGSTGALNIWTMVGATRTATTTLATNAGPTWHAVTTGDFNADTMADILLQNDSGQIAVWLMNGTTITTKSVISANPGSTWHAIDTGNFNGDGKSDILFQNSADGTIQVWTMNGGAKLAQTNISSTPGTTWQVKSSGDFNGDGKSDILMQNSSTGQIFIWTMNGTTVTSKTALATNPGTVWQVKGSADYNGDGKSDIELQNSSTGQIAVWLMNGTTIASRAILSNNPGTSWHVIAGAGG